MSSCVVLSSYIGLKNIQRRVNDKFALNFTDLLENLVYENIFFYLRYGENDKRIDKWEETGFTKRISSSQKYAQMEKQLKCLTLPNLDKKQI